ncbi:hypothetical protein [Faecalispora jeddahensis]|uniref:hypothetical protein n=1 Tax=Faecalispora jeddahensis TaxID=1414721 RepID=UPI001896E17D|nr:hypothetical protein [Faecalispora jeddahensis]
MLDLLQKIFATYNGTTYSLNDFLYSFSPENPQFVLTTAIAGLTFLIGFLEYIYSFILVRREGSAPYAVWMHTYYFAIDSMGIFVFALASIQVGGFWLFTAASIAEVVWTLFEVYNIYKSIYLERQAIWGDITVGQAWWKVIGQIVVFISVVNLFRVFMNDPAMFKWYIFTNILMGIMTGLFWEKRGTRIGTSYQLAIIICIGTINSFLPSNMWALASPYFTVANCPWFYVTGVIAVFFSIRTFWVLKKLPEKPKVLPNGKKSVW